METILFIAATEEDGTLGKPAAEALQAAATISQQSPGANWVTALFGAKVQPASETLGGCGAKRFLAVCGEDFAQPRYASDAAACEALCRAAQASIVIAPATSRMNRVLAGVTQRLGGRIDSHVTGISVNSGIISANRWYYRQRMEGMVQRTARPWVMLLEPGTVPAWQGQPSAPPLENLSVTLPPEAKRTTVVGLRATAADAQTIRPEAALLFVAGAGWTKKQGDGQTHLKEADSLIRDFLKFSRASLGSSKSLVDLGSEGQPVLPFLTHLNQVGQTGSTPRHPKGLATCCHGEEPHTVGWRFVNERRAVNLDPNCGWARGKADVLYVADAFAVIAKLNALLAAKQS